MVAVSLLHLLEINIFTFVSHFFSLSLSFLSFNRVSVLLLSLCVLSSAEAVKLALGASYPQPHAYKEDERQQDGEEEEACKELKDDHVGIFFGMWTATMLVSGVV